MTKRERTLQNIEKHPPTPAPTDERESLYDQPVSLIASGYEWICPKCDTLNHEIETMERVTCSDCGASWSVEDCYHAEG